MGINTEVGWEVNEQDYLNSLSSEPAENTTPQVDDDTFLILGVNAETWNALPPGARYYLWANEARRMLEQDWEAMQGEGL